MYNHVWVSFKPVNQVLALTWTYENDTQYPFYTVAVKHETGELMTLTHSLAETKVQIYIKMTSSLL